MNNIIKTFKEKKGSKILNIFQDQDAENPRGNSNVGTMVCFHKKYILGDPTDLKFENFDSWDALKNWLVEKYDAKIILPLYLYDHSGLRIKVGSFQGLLPQGHAEFDSGMVGFIFISKAKMIEYKLIGKGKKAENILQDEVEVYDQYLSGEVYGYEVVKENKCKDCGHVENEFIDGCSGFFGYNKAEIFEQAGLKFSDFEEADNE